MHTIQPILWKELISEYRSKQTFLTTLFFGVLVLVVGNFSLSAAGEQFPLFAPGVFWISFLFSGVLFLNHVISIEKEEDTLAGLLMSPVPAGDIFVGKLLSAVLFLTCLELVLIPFFHILFNFNFSTNSIWLFVVTILAAFGYCSVGVLFSTMSLRVKNRDILLSAILFPIMIPLLVMSVKASIILLNHFKMAQFYSWLKFLVCFDVIYVVLSYWLYSWILEEL
jgi:heme exporter protein B